MKVVADAILHLNPREGDFLFVTHWRTPTLVLVATESPSHDMGSCRAGALSRECLPSRCGKIL